MDGLLFTQEGQVQPTITVPQKNTYAAKIKDLIIQ